MPLMNDNQFTTLLNEIKRAHCLSSFEQAYHHLRVFTPDKNFFTLASMFNEGLKKFQGSNFSKWFFDLEHINMLERLRDGAKAIKKHISARGNPFNSNLHYTELSSKIGTFKGETNYEYYCEYFYKEIFTPWSQFEPRIQYVAPDCVLHSISKIEGANLIFSTHLGLQNTPPAHQWL
jgi:hypothetical protein